MNSITLVFLCLLGAALLLQLWLIQRQIRHVDTHRAQVPLAFREQISLQEHQKAADYTAGKTAFARIELVIAALLILLWTVGGGFELLDKSWRLLGLGELNTGLLVLLSSLLISTVLDLPLSAYRTFVIEQRYGFNRSTPALFLSDTLKQFVLLLAIATPLIWLALWLMQSAGPLWWLYLWLAWMGFGLLMLWAYPTLIAPMFNRFTPLDDGSLKDRIEHLLQRCGFTSRGIFVMDGSRRSAHGNAYFTGLGRNKRIVFYDTLIDGLAASEIEAVLAHELGHFKRRHVPKRLLYSAAMSLAGLALLGWLSGQQAFYQGLGVTRTSHHAAIFLFLTVTPLLGVFLQPLFALLSRRHEYEADDYAAEQTDARDLITALVKLYKENANTLTPDPLYSSFHDSHPPAALRVAHLSSRISTTPLQEQPG